MRARPTLGAICRRALRLACPACGKGRLFRCYFVRTERCDRCDWKFEREEGHWVGGSEVHMFASYGLSVLLCIPFVVVFGATTPVCVAVMSAHIILSLTVFRYSRAIFLGVDYYLDPDAPGGGDDDLDGAGEPLRPKPPVRGVRRVPAERGGTRRRRVPLQEAVGGRL